MQKSYESKIEKLAKTLEEKNKEIDDLKTDLERQLLGKKEAQRFAAHSKICPQNEGQ